MSKNYTPKNRAKHTVRKAHRLGIYLTPEAKSKGKELAEEQNRSMSNLCCVLITEEWDRKHPAPVTTNGHPSEPQKEAA